MDQVVSLDSDVNNEDPYDLSLTLEDTEDDFNIEDITEDQVKELLADEENRFLLEDDPVESTSSQINIIDRRVNDKPSKGKTLDSKSFRNTGNLITIDCDDDEDDEDGSEIDDRRHSKFKSERVIQTTDKNLSPDERNVSKTLEPSMFDSSKESHLGNKGQRNNNNNRPNTSGINMRGRGRGAINPSSRPFIGNNSLVSMGLLPTPLQSFNRIHVNPNFKPLNSQTARLSNPMDIGNFQSVMRPRSGMNQSTRMPGPHRPRGSRPVSCFADISPSGKFPANPIVPPSVVDHLIASQTLPEHEEIQMLDARANHQHHHHHHQFLNHNNNNNINNNNRPPLFNEPIQNNWHGQLGLQGQPWFRPGNRPSLGGNFQQAHGLFNPENNLNSPFNQTQRGLSVNNSLFGSTPRHSMHSRFSSLPLFNQISQPNFPLMGPILDFPRHIKSSRPEINPINAHPLPPLQRHQIPLHLVPSRPQVSTSQFNRPNVSLQARGSVPSGSSHFSSSSASSPSIVNSSPSVNSKNYHHQSTNRPQSHQVSSSPAITLDNRSPKKNHSPASRVNNKTLHRLGRSVNNNVRNIRAIMTIGSSTSKADARRAALIKSKAARRFLQKENMNRVVTSVKQVEVVDLDSANKTETPEETTQANLTKQTTDESSGKVPVVIDLDIDEEYKKKLEEQKRLREEIIRKKEERRRQMVAEKMKQSNGSTATSSTITTNQCPPSRPIATTIIERASPSKEIQVFEEKKADQGATLKRRASNDEPIVVLDKSASLVAKKVEIKGLPLTTTKATITKLCSSVGPIESCILDASNGEKKATVTFKSSKDAHTFQSRFQRHLVDLCVIQVSLLW